MQYKTQINKRIFNLTMCLMLFTQLFSGAVVKAAPVQFHQNSMALTAAGTLDTSFGDNGIAVSNLGNDIQSSTVAMQTDGKIIVASLSNSAAYSMLTRYNTDGTLDTSFGTNGKAINGLGASEGVALQPDGKIIMAGCDNRSSSPFFALVRHNSNGSLDTSFGIGGEVSTDLGNGGSCANAVAPQPDGKILAAGYVQSEDFGNSYFVLVRYNNNGSLDMSFGVNGVVSTNLDINVYGSNAIALQPNGNILVASAALSGDFTLMRYNDNGSLDISFGVNGVVSTDFGGVDYSQDVVLQPDGKIVVTGFTLDINNNSGFALARYDSNGSLDTSFGSNGLVVADLNDSEGGYVALQANGKIIVTGMLHNNVDLKFALTRYNSNGSLDTSFGANGLVFSTNLAYASRKQGHVVLQTDGKIVVVGDIRSESGQRVVLARFNNDAWNITGNAGAANATINYTGGSTTADSNGDYSITVSYGWSGTVTPSKTGYTFSPVSKPYSNIVENQTTQNYTATAITYIISGNAGIAGATLNYTDGTGKTATADSNGNYSFVVSYNWTGAATPFKMNYAFTPISKSYSNVVENQTLENYIATPAFYSRAINDGWTLESKEFSNVAGTKNNTATTLHVGDDALKKQYRSILYFDTTSLPDKADITKVTLMVRKENVTGDPSFAALGDLVADIKKGFFGLAQLELGDFNTLAESVNTGRLSAIPNSDWYQLKINPLHFKYINKFGATQFRLRFMKDDDNDKFADFISFYSGDAAIESQPQLIIEY